MASRYQQVTDPEEAWKYYEAGLLLRRMRAFSYQAPDPARYIYYEERSIAGQCDKDWIKEVTEAGIYFVLVEDE